MKLSDAIALGRTLIKSRPGAVNYDDGAGCAIGMGMAAIGRFNVEDGSDALLSGGWEWTKAFPIPLVLPCGCESANRWNSDALNHTGCIVAHLFDTHVYGKKDWTLDQLIDWVRSVEPAEPAAAAAEQQAEAELLEHRATDAIAASATGNRGAA